MITIDLEEIKKFSAAISCKFRICVIRWHDVAVAANSPRFLTETVEVLLTDIYTITPIMGSHSSEMQKVIERSLQANKKTDEGGNE